ncbi:STAS domain-containing protein [Parachryseolinea silvisoli]|jgi:anti-sigma B factor antagonist|uniref:STAS domain-containing protein n=1 Tax=Parachryseolinea silvisoli TaxID=2873601 RepID=UPI002265B694|nr:STAS domain-containing protein [Parachryseolinea silvisoli]MCD9015958.1 STAS domain-containing protein [Parachryseolinea silvisoli]
MIHIRRIQEDGADVIALIGEIDASSSIELDLAIAKSVGEGFEKILVDCGALEYISSAGLGVFMSYIEEFKDRGIRMVLFGMSDKVWHTFSILGLGELLQIGKDKVEAKQMIA